MPVSLTVERMKKAKAPSCGGGRKCTKYVSHQSCKDEFSGFFSSHSRGVLHTWCMFQKYGNHFTHSAIKNGDVVMPTPRVAQEGKWSEYTPNNASVSQSFRWDAVKQQRYACVCVRAVCAHARKSTHLHGRCKKKKNTAPATPTRKKNAVRQAAKLKIICTDNALASYSLWLAICVRPLPATLLLSHVLYVRAGKPSYGALLYVAACVPERGL